MALGYNKGVGEVCVAQLSIIFLIMILSSFARAGDAELFCPTDSERKPNLIFKHSSKPLLFICGETDVNRAPPKSTLLLTILKVYSFNEDGSPTMLMENDIETKNYLVTETGSGFRLEEVQFFSSTPTALFATSFSCSGDTCHQGKQECLKSIRRFEAPISKKTLLDTQNVERAEDDLQNIFKSALSGSAAARHLFKDSKFKESLESPVRDMYDRFESILNLYWQLGC